jgi:TRAP-type uncharacterized transport system substrate-binding protein
MVNKPDIDSVEHTHWREWLRVLWPFALLALVGLAIVWPMIQPAPPKRVVIATGPEGSSYNDFAAEYAKYFAERGVKLEIRKTNGSRENYTLLADPKSDVDAALVQGGTALPRDQIPNLEAICAVSFEPLFILYRSAAFEGPVTRLEQLKGKRVAVGKATGGTYWLSTPLLTLHAIGTADDKATTIKQISGEESIKQLIANEVDVGFYSVSADTAYILDALRTPGIQIASLKLASGYAHRFEFVTTVTLPEGALDLGKDLPDHDVRMVAPTTALISRKSTHKAIIQLLVQAAQKVHSKRDPLAPPGAFPTQDYTELPVGADARYFFTTKPGILQQTLPFWLASLIDRLLILMVPLLVVLIPLFRLAPRLYQWRMRARVYKWYKRLRALDARLFEPSTPRQLAADREEADNLEREIAKAVKVPLSYMGAFYSLRIQLAYLRDQFKVEAKPGDDATRK